LKLPVKRSSRQRKKTIEILPGVLAQMRAGRRALRSGPRFFRHAALGDGSDYLWWPRLFEFLVSRDGRRILYRCLDARRREAFLTYLLGQALSFALIKLGAEPIHATAVDVGRGAIVFLGDSGYGKSTLATSFLRAGHRILTDDLLLFCDDGPGVKAYPGPSRIKLMEDRAWELLPGIGPAGPMNRRGGKLIIPLAAAHGAGKKTRILAFYDLLPPGEAKRLHGISIQRLSSRDAFFALTRNTFNPRVATPSRLRQLFATATRIASKVPVKRLAFPRRLDVLPLVREAILRDVAKELRRTDRQAR
jgi:hypothetical protein